MTWRYRELVLPSPVILGFGLVTAGVLGIAVWYATDLILGAAAATFLLGLTLLYLVNQTHWIKVDTQLRVGRYSLPVELIANSEILDHQQFRTSLKTTDLVLGTNSARQYLRLEIADQADPFQVWLVATKNPEKLKAALS